MPPLETDRLLDRIVASIREESIPDFLDADGTRFPEPNEPQVCRSNVTGWSGTPSSYTRQLVTALAIAAAFILVFFGAFTFSRRSGGASIAFAEVKVAVGKVQTMRCRFLDFHGDKEPLVTTVVSASGIGMRSEGPGGVETIANLRSERMVVINHKKRTAQIMQLYLEPGEAPEHDRFTDMIRNLPSVASELGSEEINGKKVLKYAFQHDGEYVVFVDAATKLPVRMELTLEKESAGLKNFREVVTDFVFDTPIDEPFFEIATPEGYQVSKCEEPEDRKSVDTRSFVVSPAVGFAGLPLGATKDQIIAALGPPDEIQKQSMRQPASIPGPNAPESEQVTHRLRYPSLGFDIAVSSDQGMTEVRCYGRREQGNMARDFLGKTDKQLGLGTSIEDVLRAYGKPEVRIEARNQQWLYPHQGWDFRFRDKELAGFTMAKAVADNVLIRDNGDGSWETTVKPK